jgi:stage II sporulation protein D
MKLVIATILICLSIFGFSQKLKVGILRAYDLTAVKVGYNSGNYRIIGDSTELTTIWKDQTVYFRRSGNGVKVEKAGKSLGVYDTIYLKEISQDCDFTIQPIHPASAKVKKYQDDLLIVASGKTEITVINEVELENYLGGVIESEGGGGKHIEYYKVQAILSRTYVLDHLRKHKKDGFSVCDRVHCQAYHSMLRFTPTIKEAVTETKGIIMLDKRLKLADGFFFANCGGQTSESDFVWNVAVPYCRSIVDTFCIQSRQANWTQKIKKTDWKAYLTEQFGYPLKDSIFGKSIYAFNQPSRKAFYVAPQLGIPLRDLRVKFRLKSTWFSTHEEGEYVVLEGKGFGHGVGLCQEGAMKMAKLNYSFEQILYFYFTDVQIFDYFHWLFLKQETEVGL